MRTVELRKCEDSNNPVSSALIGVHGHLFVDGDEITQVGSKGEMRRMLEERVKNGLLLPEDLSLFTQALENANWLPEEADGNTLKDVLNNVKSLSELLDDNRFQNFLERDLFPKIRQYELRQEEANRRALAHLAVPPQLTLYRSDGGETIGSILCGSQRESLVRCQTDLYGIIQMAVESGNAKAGDFEPVHAALLEANLPYSNDGRKLSEGFMKFEAKDGERIGRLVDAQGDAFLSIEQLPLIRALTGGELQFTPALLPIIIRQITNSGLPISLEPERRQVDLGDGYTVQLTYCGGHLMSASASYKAPQAPEQVEGAEASPLPAGNGDEQPLDVREDIEGELSGGASEESASVAADDASEEHF